MLNLFMPRHAPPRPPQRHSRRSRVVAVMARVGGLVHAFATFSPHTLPSLPRRRGRLVYPTRPTTMCASPAVLPRIVDIVRRAAGRESAERVTGRAVLPSVFSGRRNRSRPVLTDDDVRALQEAMADIDPSELGVTGLHVNGGNGSLPLNGNPPPIGYCHVGGNENLVDMSIFLIPPSAAIPIHNHPSMFVFSRVLFGKLEVDEYEVEEGASKGLLPAHKTTSTSAAGDVRMLTPRRGNIHSFRAVDWTAVFDVAVPPYSDSYSGSCRYFAPFQDDPLLLKVRHDPQVIGVLTSLSPLKCSRLLTLRVLSLLSA